MDIVDGYLGYLGAKLSALPLVTSPYYSKHVACTLQQLSVGRADVNRRGRGGTQRLADSFKLCVLRALCGLPFSLFKRNML